MPGLHIRQRIWKTVCRIPRGRVATYGTVARLSGMDGQARLVGYTLHALPAGMEIPWQRVVNSQGRISLKGDAGRTQRLMLENEGVVFLRDRIDLRRFGWNSIIPSRSSGHKRQRPYDHTTTES
ncbi:MAG: MGMT family protein [Bacteroidetes bacterium]|nr:MGMT family protein [Bacteroidota bacterium]